MRKLIKELDNLKRLECKHGLTMRQVERMEELYEKIYS